MSTPYDFPHIKKAAFLKAFIECAGNLTKAAEAVKIDRGNHYDWLRDDKEYAAAFEDARKYAAQRLQDEATRRAFNGVSKPIYQQGKKVGVVQEYSDTLLIFLLKGAMPETYRERQAVETTASLTVDGKIGYQAYGEAVAAPAVVETLPAAKHEDEDAIQSTDLPDPHNRGGIL